MSKKKTKFVVGIGASAGGLEALRPFAENLGPLGNMSLIIAHHVSPTHPSMLAVLLKDKTQLKVIEAEDNAIPAPGTIQVIPNNRNAYIENGRIRLSQPESTSAPQPSIDLFFSSLAEEYKEAAIGILFSGTGFDGAYGCKAIKAAGGITIAQQPTTARFDGMPNAAIQLADVDWVLTPIEAAQKLSAIAENPQLPWPDLPETEAPQTCHDIIEKILKSTGLDFLNYKSSTISRQVKRRMALMQIDSYKAYGNYIAKHPEEPLMLANNLLVCVTSFFRDTECFDALKKALADLIKSKKNEYEIRVWVPGCATGEEAYSIAILLAEELGARINRYRVQIYGTDINAQAIQFARTGVYGEASLVKLPLLLRKKYFTRRNQTYCVDKQLRDMTVFSRHNLLKSPPFIRMDLISCRNVLIYLDQSSQQRILKHFHYGLRTNGLLFLGRSESIGNLADAFSELDKTNKLFVKRNTHVFLPRLFSGNIAYPDAAQKPTVPDCDHPNYRSLGEKKIVEIYSKPGILAAQNGNILEFYNDCTPFIKIKPGKADFNLFSIIDPPLKTELKALCHKANSAKIAVVSHPVTLATESPENAYRIRIDPIICSYTSEQLVLFTFDKIDSTPESTNKAEKSEHEELTTELKHELAITRETLQTLTEALESTIAELQSINEEAQTANEELQSANEELETSNEELQSTNEELTLVNDELALKTQELGETNTDLENILNSLQKAVLVVDENLLINRYNEICRNFFNFNAIENEPLNLSSVEILFDAGGLFGQIKKVLASEQAYRNTLSIEDKAYELMIYPYRRRKATDKKRAVLTITDITEKLRAEKEISTAAKVFDAASEAIAVTDRENRIVSVNPAFEKITGYRKDEVIGKNPKILNSCRQGKDFYRTMWNSLENTGRWQGEIWNQRKNGEIYPEWLSISTLTNGNGETNGYIGIFTDITEALAAEQLIRQQANFDALTQLPNRQLYCDRLQQAMIHARRMNKLVGVMFIDLDGFKEINDSFGHSQGDLVLQRIAERIVRVKREADTFARFGGDEFTVLLANLESETDAIPIAEKILLTIEEPLKIDDFLLNITASIGIAIFPNNGRDAETLLKHADNAMYKAKAAGHNSYQFFTPKMHKQVLAHHRIANDLKFAAKYDKFELHYQPIVEMKSSRIMGVEALIRWNHPANGFISPEEFIPIAEKMNLISAIGENVLDKACRFTAGINKKMRHPIYLAVNFSTQQFIHGNRIEKWMEIIEDSRINAGNVVIEITESLMMSHQNHYLRELKSLRKSGVRIAMDDFGTGYSSLSYLKKIPLDILKIDKSFIRDILVDSSDASLVETILNIADNFGLKVVAEGVENSEQSQFLIDKGCPFGQGFYYSNPLPESEFAKLVLSHT
ncbi:MAG: EAL domain-containing protein [Gammaproteobacteria bacterium]